MIEYFDSLTQEEQETLTEVIQTLFRQTFLLERKFDKRAGRMQYEKAYRMCSKHFEFLKDYFAVAGIRLQENAHMGLIYIQGETLWGDKLPRLATIYLLVLKLLYDEQMAAVSSSSHIVTTLGAVNGKAGEFGVLPGLPSLSEMRRTVALLKKYQVIEPLDVMDELSESTRMIIYPSINAVLIGDDIRELLASFAEAEEMAGQIFVEAEEMAGQIFVETEENVGLEEMFAEEEEAEGEEQERERQGRAGQDTLDRTEEERGIGEETAVQGTLEDLPE